MYSGSIDGTVRCWVTEFADSTRRYCAHEHMISDMKYHDGFCKKISIHLPITFIFFPPMPVKFVARLAADTLRDVEVVSKIGLS